MYSSCFVTFLQPSMVLCSKGNIISALAVVQLADAALLLPTLQTELFCFLLHCLWHLDFSMITRKVVLEPVWRRHAWCRAHWKDFIDTCCFAHLCACFSSQSASMVTAKTESDLILPSICESVWCCGTIHQLVAGWELPFSFFIICPFWYRHGHCHRWYCYCSLLMTAPILVCCML